MELGAPDTSGRRSPVATGQTVEIPADMVISATGTMVDKELLERFGIRVDAKGLPVLNGDTLETGAKGVYIAGDAARGPASVAEAIADAIKCATALLATPATPAAPDNTALNINPDKNGAIAKKGILFADTTTVHESKRCLECSTVCECCVDVCPNRANTIVEIDGRPQIIHIDSMCNECGNCEIFCPYSSAPYLDKFTLFECEEDFDESKNAGFLALSNGTYRVRLDGVTADHSDDANLPADIWKIIISA